jgi:hypothetical protein
MLRADGDGERQDEAADQAGGMKGKPTRHAFAGADRIIHHVRWQHPPRLSLSDSPCELRIPAKVTMGALQQLDGSTKYIQATSSCLQFAQRSHEPLWLGPERRVEVLATFVHL